MNQAQQNAFNRALQTLTALQAKFHIALPSGDTLARLQSCMASIASHDWGNGTYTTAIEPSKGVVSIFREA